MVDKLMNFLFAATSYPKAKGAKLVEALGIPQICKPARSQIRLLYNSANREFYIRTIRMIP